jgi:hypothetical protein
MNAKTFLPFLILATMALAATAQPPPPFDMPHRILRVNCGQQSIQKAIDTSNRFFGPVEIVVAPGICDENIVIARDDIWIHGESPGSTVLHNPHYEPFVGIRLVGAKRIFISGLTVDKWHTALAAESGSSFVAHGVEFRDATGAGVEIRDGSTGQIDEAMIRFNGGSGVQVDQASFVALNNVEVNNNKFKGVYANGGDVTIQSSDINDNDSDGVFGWRGSAIKIQNTDLERNGSGVILWNNATVSLWQALVRNNLNVGVSLFNGSVADIDMSSIVDNGGDGVSATGGSVAMVLGDFGTTVIGRNDGHGVALTDTSFLEGGGIGMIIFNNGGWGVICEPAPAVAMVPPDSIKPHLVYGNLAGQISCPGFP